MGWIFQGNPKNYDVDGYLASYPQLVYWHTPRYSQDIKIGDRAFIWRAGSEAGVIAAGVVTEVCIPPEPVKHPEARGDSLWHNNKPDPSDPKTGIQLLDIRLTSSEGMIQRETVKQNAVLSASTIIRMPNGTVFKLSSSEVVILEELWGIGLSPVSGASVPAITRDEGAYRLRTHYLRERSTRLRSDKLTHSRSETGIITCELCGLEEGRDYPDAFGERIFEVHHRIPLSQSVKPIKTSLEDLAILCANCHRAVHLTRDVDTNYQLLKRHFSEKS